MTRRYGPWKPDTTPPPDDRQKPEIVSIWTIVFWFLGGRRND
jgi:hypothetical protein